MDSRVCGQAAGSSARPASRSPWATVGSDEAKCRLTDGGPTGKMNRAMENIGSTSYTLGIVRPSGGSHLRGVFHSNRAGGFLFLGVSMEATVESITVTLDRTGSCRLREIMAGETLTCPWLEVLGAKLDHAAAIAQLTAEMQ
jgi:hypothetical protein